MSFVKPMLAAPMPTTPINFLGQPWAIEEKYDGHRLLVSVQQRLPPFVEAWSRNGLTRSLPAHLREQLANLPAGLYDGELAIPGKRSYGVTEIVNGPDLRYTVFDVLDLLGRNTMALPYKDRREFLVEMFQRPHLVQTHVVLAPSTVITNDAMIDDFFRAVLAKGGEGLILKRLAAPYSPGKRYKDSWVKIKDKRTAVFTVIGFEPSRGTIQNRGPYAMVALRDEDGHEITVKTINDAQCRKFEEEGAHLGFMEPHPSLGRKLRIEYQERTNDGSYRHPMWDRWEDE
jgi:DNA ligase-1